MRLVYRTGIATFVQFIVMSLLGLANSANSIVTTCHADKGDCVSNLIVSIIFFLLLAIWFGVIWIVGSIAQEQRSKRLAQILICIEAGVFVVALFNTRHHTDILSLATSVSDIAFSVWVGVLAYRLSKSHGGRIVRRRVRQEH